MQKPWAMRSAVKVARSSVKASSAVGIASSVRLIQIPLLRSIRSARSAQPMLAAAIPIAEALTAKPIAAGPTP